MTQAQRRLVVSVFLVFCFLAVLLGSVRAYKTPGGRSFNGDQEILADPDRPIIYWAHPAGRHVSVLDAHTGIEIATVMVGWTPTSIDLSPDHHWLYVAVSGTNQTLVINTSSLTIARTIDLDFSPLSLRAGPNDRLFISGIQDGLVRILNATTGVVLNAFAPMNASLPWLLEVSPDGTYILVHLLTSDQVHIAKYGVVGDRFTFIAADNNDLGENFMQMAVDWSGGIAYLVSGTPYGIEMVSLANMTRLGWLRMWAYPNSVALFPNRHIVVGFDRGFYDSALWVFDTTTRAQLNKIPIYVSPNNIAPDQVLMVASAAAGTLLLWTEEGERTFTIDPSVEPGNPRPDSKIAGYPPYYAAAHFWRGLVEPASNTTSISVDGKGLDAVYEARWDLVDAWAPTLPVGHHNITAGVSWPRGSQSITWNFTVTSPPAVATFEVRPSGPLHANQLIEFDASQASGLGGIVAFLWRFGDGTTASGSIVDHVFGSPGTYHVSLAVTSGLNVSATQDQDVVIEATLDVMPLIASTLGSVVLVVAVVFVILRRRRQSPPPPDHE